jgi:carbamoyl-phosphate synthase large subunit
MSQKKKQFNILVTACGGPAGTNALKLLSKIKGVSLFGVDSDELSAGRYWTKEFKKAPNFNTDKESYKKALLSLIKKWDIDLVLPTLAEELSQIEEMLKGQNVPIVVSPKETCELCEDKINFYEFLKSKVPEFVPEFSFENSKKLSIQEEYFIKPRFGRGSRGCRKVSRNELLALEKAKCLQDTIVMENLPGMEWTVDAYFNQEGKEVFLVPRERLGFSGGISAKGKTVKNKKVIGVARKVLSFFKFVGPVFIQLKESKTGDIKVVEINPRLSGGITITALSGADPMKILVEEYRDKKVTEVIWKPKTVVRFLEDIVIQ